MCAPCFFSKCLRIHQLLFFVRGVRSFVLAGVFRGVFSRASGLGWSKGGARCGRFCRGIRVLRRGGLGWVGGGGRGRHR